MSYSQVTYKLINNDTGAELKLDTPQSADPINWDNSEKTLKRSPKTFGVVTELSKDLEFVKEAKAFLDNAYLVKGIEASVTMEEYRDYPDKEGNYLHSTGLFDFSEYKTSKIKTKVPFKTGGLNAQIKAQFKEKFELERTESITGAAIDELPKIDFTLSARKILRLSEMESVPYELDQFGRPVSDFYSGILNITPLMKVVSDSDTENLQQVIVEPVGLIISGAPILDRLILEQGNCFYFNNSIAKTVTLTINIDVELGGFFQSRSCFVALIKTDENFDRVSHPNEILYDDGGLINGNLFLNINPTISIDLAENENLSLVILADVFSNSGTPSAQIRYYSYTDGYKDSPITINISEDSTFDDTPVRAVLFHEVGEKLLQIITGQKKAFYSEFFGRTNLGYTNTGEFANVALSLGFWIRQFFDKKFQFSLSDYLETANAVFNTGYGIELINGKETLVLEDLKYFFQEGVAIVLPNQVSNVERKVAKEFYNSSIEIGYEKPDGDNLYEEAMGLDEYNGKRGFTQPITRVDTTYKKISKARADRYGIEFARRKPQKSFPETDTRYDSSAFLFDLMDQFGQQFRERFSNDDFIAVPTGVYSPETATNLRITPFRNLERHGWLFGSGLQKFQDEKIRFSNSTLNSDLTTQKSGEVARSESGDILVSDLQRPRFKPEWITFDYKVDFAVNEMVYGKTNVNGRMIPNYYFKVQFINEFGLTEYGYLFELKPNKEGKWKILTANT